MGDVTIKADKPKLDTYAILANAAKRAGQGGLAGAAAMGINVCSLMWMRTTINYQYRYGTSTMTAFRTLYADGGIPRFYRGLIPALVQGPLSRFGDTAANTGTLALLDAYETTEKLPVAAKTVAASVAAGLFRIFLMPVDTFKTTMCVEIGNRAPMPSPSPLTPNDPSRSSFPFSGKWRARTASRSSSPSSGRRASRRSTKGRSPLRWRRSSGTVTRPASHLTEACHLIILPSLPPSVTRHYPWFFTYNFLNDKLPRRTDTVGKLCRSALIGFCASAISDTCSNSIRVIKVQ